ncbi:protein strawberry notch 1 [Echinococcus multilocularis]|uniref:Protein strawberry notch 1 n=1 Tax=Echinococcus multilocularis TaxID=6211 RepID=A0A068YIF5_ECHMU|nr:protein strawberry notch 1 [Echinococcus multilocularis]
MEPADAFEIALQGLTAKDDSLSMPVTEQVSPDSAIVADVKPAESGSNQEDYGLDIISKALKSAGITPSDVSNPVTTVASTQIYTVINQTGSPLVQMPSVTNTQLRVPTISGVASRLIQLSKVSRAPTIIRKRLSAEPAAFPPVKFIRRGDAPSSGPVKIETVSDMKFRTQALGPQRIPMNYPLNFLSQKRDEEIEEDDSDDLAQAETYADYVPAKLHLGCRHPDPIVESSTLSSVSPPDIHYNLRLPREVIDSGRLSALQLEAVVYASQRHECILPNGQRAGFLIGDGAGVGKGRTIAAIIYENYMQHRKKAIWLSVSNDLRVDAERDLRDVGLTKLEVHSLNKFRYAKISGKVNGSVKKGVLFSTYSSLIGESQGGAKAKYKTRLKQIVHWCSKDFDGVIVFDECHRAKNLTPSGSQKPTKTGLTVLELQNRLPNARIVYASATGATEPRNMAYMTRLGLWGKGTPFKDFNSFIQFIERRGVGGMELVAMDMKLRGMYIARQLSFHGVKFTIRPVEIEYVLLNGQSFVNVYNQSADLWVCAYEYFSEAARLINASDKYRKTMWGQFWSAHQRFFKYLCIAAKVDACVELCKMALNAEKCVVIGLQSTGEAKTLEQVEEFGTDLGEFVSTAKGVLQSLVERYFPTASNLESFAARGEKLTIAGDRSSSTTLTRAGRAVAGGKGSGLGLKDILGEKAFAKLIAGGSLTGYDDDDSDRGNPGSGATGTKKGDSDDPDSDEDDDNDDEWGNESDNQSKANGGDSSSEYYDSDLEISNNCRGGVKRTKKSRIGASSKRKQVYESDAAADSDDDDMDYDAMCDTFFARQRERAIRQNDSLWADESTRNLSAKYFLDSKSPDGMLASNGSVSLEEARKKCDGMKELLLGHIERIGRYLPPSSLDELIEKLGGPSRVAEMTGRRGRVVMNDSGRALYESRREGDCAMETINLMEKQRFMDGEKLIAIVSEAASSGISLQADRRAKNQRRRVHITLELPWSADRAIQQFGRTHRSNQVSSPEYIFLISDLAGEQRFASTVAKRLESLGALTHGDRRATETRDLSRFNIDTKLGREALDIVLKTCIWGEEGIIKPPADYRSEDPIVADAKTLEPLPPTLRPYHQFLSDVKSGLQGVGFLNGRTRDKDSRHMVKFLNRILGLHVHTQNAFFQYFSDTLEELVRRAKRGNRLDLGIMDLGTTGQNLEIVWTRKFDTRFLSDSTQVCLHKVTTQRGVSWASAMELYAQHDGDEDGFYLPKQSTVSRVMPLLAFCLRNKAGDVGDRERRKMKRLYRVYRPNTGMQSEPMEYGKLTEQYAKVSNPTDCQEHWSTIYDESATRCIHLIQRNHCNRVSVRNPQGRPGICEVGLRERTYYVLSGSVMNVWTHVERVLTNQAGNSPPMQVVRLKPKDGKRIVGVLIPQDGVEAVLDCLNILQSNPDDIHLRPAPLPSGLSQPIHQVRSLLRSSLPPPIIKSTGQPPIVIGKPSIRFSVANATNTNAAAMTRNPVRNFGNGTTSTITTGVASSNAPTFLSPRMSFTTLHQPLSRFPLASRAQSRLEAAFQCQPISQTRNIVPQRVFTSINASSSQQSNSPQRFASPRGFQPSRPPSTRVTAPRTGRINWVSQDNGYCVNNLPVQGVFQPRLQTQQQLVQLQQVYQQPQRQQPSQQKSRQLSQVPPTLVSAASPNNTANPSVQAAVAQPTQKPFKMKFVWKGVSVCTYALFYEIEALAGLSLVVCHRTVLQGEILIAAFVSTPVPSPSVLFLSVSPCSMSPLCRLYLQKLLHNS